MKLKKSLVVVDISNKETEFSVMEIDSVSNGNKNFDNGNGCFDNGNRYF